MFKGHWVIPYAIHLCSLGTVAAMIDSLPTEHNERDLACEIIQSQIVSAS